MKKLLMIAALACVGVSAYAADAATLYKKCAVCHGAKAEKVYLNKVPALKTISKAERLKYMKEYAAGTRNAYGQGAIMKLNLKGLTEADFVAIEDYIDSPTGKIVYIVFSVILGIVCLIFAVNAFLPEEKKFLRKNSRRAAQEDLRYIPLGFASRKEYVDAMKKQAGRYYYAVKKMAPDGETTDVTAPYYEKETYAATGEVKAFYLDREGWVSFNKKSNKAAFIVASLVGVLINGGLWVLLLVTISSL